MIHGSKTRGTGEHAHVLMVMFTRSVIEIMSAGRWRALAASRANAHPPADLTRRMARREREWFIVPQIKKVRTNCLSKPECNWMQRRSINLLLLSIVDMLRMTDL